MHEHRDQGVAAARIPTLLAAVDGAVTPDAGLDCPNRLLRRIPGLARHIITLLAIPQNSLPTASTDCHGFAVSGFASNLSR
jgi:hypothetical protein